jgi:hypothetical protein
MSTDNKKLNLRWFGSRLPEDIYNRLKLESALTNTSMEKIVRTTLDENLPRRRVIEVKERKSASA